MEKPDALALRSALEESGVRFRKVEALVAAGWTVPMVREAADIAQAQNVRFGYIARMEQHGIPVPIIGELVDFKRQHPEIGMPLLWECWQLCVSGERVTDHDRDFFSTFLDAAEELFMEAPVALGKSSVARRPNFILMRLIEYVRTQADADIEAVHQEMVDDPAGTLRRIMASSQRSHEPSPAGTVIRGNPFDHRVDLTDIEEE